ncbi:MAG TPA: energy transducer TonB [Nitrospira sp.]|nr:energy transducer TonB [Nitrospira sp.]
MTSTDETRFFFPAWGISLTLHGAVVALALAFTAQVKPILQENLFQWDVALVEAAKQESISEQAPSVVPSEQLSAKILSQPRPKRATEVSQAVKPLEQNIVPPPPTIESAQKIEQKVENPQPREEPMEQRMVETVEPKAEPAVETKEPEPVAAPPAQPEQGAVAAQQEAPAASPSQEAPMDPAPMEVARAPASASEAKIDHRWLAESLWRRVAELKRYPNSARMNGQEGKVVLKAVIRSDGQLADVFVQKSSGHSVLDAAAIEAVKLACPLHMKHAIGKPQIVVSLPIVYSLAN